LKTAVVCITLIYITKKEKNLHIERVFRGNVSIPAGLVFVYLCWVRWGKGVFFGGKWQLVVLALKICYSAGAYETGPNLLKLGIKPGFANKSLQLNELDKEVIAYLCVQAERFHKSHTQIINDLVYEKLAVGV